MKKYKRLIHWEGKVATELSLNGPSRISLGKEAETDPSPNRQSCEREYSLCREWQEVSVDGAEAAVEGEAGDKARSGGRV